MKLLLVSVCLTVCLCFSCHEKILRQMLTAVFLARPHLFQLHAGKKEAILCVTTSLSQTFRNARPCAWFCSYFPRALSVVVGYAKKMNSVLITGNIYLPSVSQSKYVHGLFHLTMSMSALFGNCKHGIKDPRSSLTGKIIVNNRNEKEGIPDQFNQVVTVTVRVV